MPKSKTRKTSYYITKSGKRVKCRTCKPKKQTPKCRPCKKTRKPKKHTPKRKPSKKTRKPKKYKRKASKKTRKLKCKPCKPCKPCKKPTQSRKTQPIIQTPQQPLIQLIQQPSKDSCYNLNGYGKIESTDCKPCNTITRQGKNSCEQEYHDLSDLDETQKTEWPTDIGFRRRCRYNLNENKCEDLERKYWLSATLANSDHLKL